MSDLHLTIGPPGTGKTTFLARQAKRAIEARGADAVAVASLTKTAAAEVAGRDTGLPSEAIGTLHAHAYRTLDSPLLAETPEGLAEWNQAHPTRRLRPGGGDQPDDTRPGAQHLHAEVMAHRSRLTPTEAWSPAQQAHHQAWTDYKRQTGRLDFADLIEKATLYDHHLHPQVWLIDEAQDLSLLELRLITTWARRADVTVLVGDPQQALYQWRGSDPDALTSLPYTTRRVLDQSWRVPAAVHSAATRWIARSNHPAVAYHPTPNTGVFRRHHATLQQPQRIAELATSQEGTVMVQTTCRYMLAPILKALTDAGVPYSNTHRPVREWNPLTDAHHLQAYLADPAGWTWMDLHLWTTPLDGRRALPTGAKAVIDERAQLIPRTHVPVADVLELLAGPGALDHPALTGDLDWYRTHLRATWRPRLHPALDLIRRHGAPVLTTPPRIQVGTVHSFKGAEADTTIIAPDTSRTSHSAAWTWGRGSHQRDALLRLGYVALTRARHQAIVLTPAGPTSLPIGALA